MISRCIVREPCPEMVKGLSEAQTDRPDYRLAREQHVSYTEALNLCAVKGITLPPDPAYPDSVFVEDTALLIPEAAIIAQPGAPSRRGEIVSMINILKEHFTRVEEIHAPGTLDAGDVLEVEDHYFVGLSRRTNPSGAGQLIGYLEKYGKTGSTVPLKNYLHLKSGVSYLGDKTLLVSGELKKCLEFRAFNLIEVDDSEDYAANAVLINDRVVIPAGYPRTLDLLATAGYNVLPVEMSEFRKLDGGISCLSLRF